jgi:hypothetical protein
MLFVFAILIAATKTLLADNISPTRTPVSIIFDTDMGNDIDDALALAMLGSVRQGAHIGF